MQVKYLMITHWDGYWDEIRETFYTKSMFREGMREDLIEENAPTIFIKINKRDKTPEKAWIGTVSNFRVEAEKVRFKVNIEKEIPVPEEYRGKPEGWYFIGEKEISPKEKFPFESKSIFYPPFFFILHETNDWKSFENYVYYLLKLVGINDIYKFEEQRGHPDGFFRVKRLAVIYDCTLERDFEKSKKQQIENFCFQLSKNDIEIGKNRIPIKDCQKEVWIITKGEQSRIIEKTGEVTVKEVSIYTLFDLYFSRIKEISSEEELEEKLKSSGR